MSVVEYNSLLFEISQRLDELNACRKLLVMCRGKVAHRSDENIMGDVRSLFKELENNESLGIDRLEVLKRILTQKEQRELLQEVVDLQERR
ncbi:unnamed protein product, partial [Porites evermanni]